MFKLWRYSLTLGAKSKPDGYVTLISLMKNVAFIVFFKTTFAFGATVLFPLPVL
jgi:hypothetical protein